MTRDRRRFNMVRAIRKCLNNAQAKAATSGPTQDLPGTAGCHSLLFSR